MRRPVELRIGIATGLAVIGEEPATAKAKEPTAVGETPDLAFRYWHTQSVRCIAANSSAN